jgi:uncharacterized damage-inducible protein DinB
MLPELDEILRYLTALRAKMLGTLEDAGPAAWNWTPTSDNSNSLYVLATHAIGSEHGWIFEILGQGDKTRDRASEFRAAAHDLGELHASYARVAQETQDLLATLTGDDLVKTRFREGYGQVSGRWILLHVIAHYSEHLGQMYLTKQLWERNRA